MEIPDSETPAFVGCVVALAALFVAREVAAGVMREAGGDLWRWIKRMARR